MDNANLDALPLEIRENVASFLEEEDLRNFRHVSKACEEGSRKLFAQTFFSHITVFLAHVSLERLCAICAHSEFGPYVRRINFISRRLDENQGDIAESLLSMCLDRETEEEEAREHIAMVELVAAAYTKQQCMVEYGIASTMLERALTSHAKHDKPLTLGLCNALTLSEASERTFSNDTFDVFEASLGFKTFFENISVMRADLSRFQWQEWRTWTLDLLITASREHNSISGFVLHPIIDYDKDYHNAQDDDRYRGQLCLSGLSDTSRLRKMCAALHSVDLEFDPTHSHTREMCEKILSWVDQVHVLRLKFNSRPRPIGWVKPSHRFLKSCFRELAQICPDTCKLTSLTLENVWARKADIKTLLGNHRETLTVLDMEDFYLKGSWKETLEWMKENMTALKILRLRYLYTQLPGRHGHHWPVFSGTVECSSVDQAIMEVFAGHRRNGRRT